MDSELENIIRKMRNATTIFDFFDFEEINSINAVNLEGENLLHAVVQHDDIEAARFLIEKGIDIEQPGDLGRTPLHYACSRGNLEMVKLLVGSDADVHALDEGVPPFTLARYGNHDKICDYLADVMKEAQSENPNIWKQARINQLHKEIIRLEQSLKN